MFSKQHCNWRLLSIELMYSEVVAMQSQLFHPLMKSNYWVETMQEATLVNLFTIILVITLNIKIPRMMGWTYPWIELQEFSKQR